MTLRSVEDLLCCAKCGDVALIAAAVATAPLVKKPWIAGYYGHCMDGDCGQQGPTVADEGQARLFWNEQQRNLQRDMAQVRHLLEQAQQNLWAAMYYVRNHEVGISERQLKGSIQTIEKLQAKLREAQSDDPKIAPK